MFYVERSNDKDGWDLMLYSPHRIGIDDLQGPPGPRYNNHIGTGDLHAASPTPGNKSHFAGRRGQEARVRYQDTVIERFEWAPIPVNENDPESDTIWGWKMIAQYHAAIPAEKLWPLAFIG